MVSGEEQSEFMSIDTVTAHDPIGQDSPNENKGEPALTMQDLDEYLTGAYDYQAPKHGDIRHGVVVEINDNGVIMDIGSKREGFVPADDLARLDEEIRTTVQVGSTVPVFVIRPSDNEGRPLLSIHQAHMYQDWLDAEELMKSGELYEGEVSNYNRGGLIVKFGKIRGFVPTSQVVGLPRRLREEQRRQRLAAMIGEHIGLRVIEVDRQRRRLIFSQRRALRAWQELQRERVMKELREGETRHGKVTSITDFGAFVDLGGADGLIHVSELSWRRVEHPREVLRVGDEVDVYVLSVDRERKRIALSLKKLQPDPWTMVDDHYRIGQLVEGRVTRVVDFGAFVAVDLGIEGLLHAKEMIGTPELAPADIVQSGDTLPVKIIGIDSRRRRLDLSAKQVRQDEWERWMAEQQAAQEAKEAAVDSTVAEMAVEVAVEAAAEVAEAEAGAPDEVAEVVAEEAALTADSAVEEVAAEVAAAEVAAAEVAAPDEVDEAAAEEAGPVDVEEIVAEAAAMADELPEEEVVEPEAAVAEEVVEEAAPAGVEEAGSEEDQELVGEAGEVVEEIVTVEEEV
jgi:small subunit ribosomal protein S1